MSHIVLEGVTKSFTTDQPVVKDLDLKIDPGEFVVLLGPSGCGKTTTLRIIAGLEKVTSGQVYIDDRPVTNLAPRHRDVAMVFQNYALYPHLNVYDNIAFGLKARKFPKKEIRKRVVTTAQILGLESYLNRKPKHLSGGERQRVALGRAMVRNPKAFLMDEPLSNLDAKLRLQMRFELLKLHQELQVTTIYVTHDQIEALTLGERLVVMKDGVVQQIGDPFTIYNRPANMYVASFIGSPPMNLFDVKVVSYDGGLYLKADGISLKVPKSMCHIEQYVNRSVVLGLRPEDITDKETVRPTSTGILTTATVRVVEPMGSHELLYASIGKQEFAASISAGTEPFNRYNMAGQKIELLFHLEKLHLFDRKTERAIINP